MRARQNKGLSPPAGENEPTAQLPTPTAPHNHLTYSANDFLPIMRGSAVCLAALCLAAMLIADQAPAIMAQGPGQQNNRFTQQFKMREFPRCTSP